MSDTPLKWRMYQVGDSGSLDQVRKFLQEHPELVNENGVSGWHPWAREKAVGHENPFAVRGLDDSFFFFSSLLG